jgi:hypothetical protein
MFGGALAACLAAILLCTLSNKAGASVDFAKLDNELRATITNAAISDEVLLECISRLGKTTEPASFWTQLANNDAYSIGHRVRAVFALFRRHGQWCGDVGSLGRTLAPARWLDQSNIERVTYVFGNLPIEVNPGESVYRISVLHRASIYVRMQGEVDIATFAGLLRGGHEEAFRSNPRVLECAYGDDYDAWLRNNPPKRE